MEKVNVVNELRKVASLLTSAQTADGEYKARVKDVLRLLKDIKKEVAVHQKQQVRDPKNWGYVGDMGHVYMELDSISRFLKG
jgi:hypothetical protein